MLGGLTASVAGWPLYRKRPSREKVDVVVIGSGNAGFSAALAAAGAGARVVLLEKGARDWLGGNSYFTAGAFRTTYESIGDLSLVLDDPSSANSISLDPYRADAFEADLLRMSGGRCDPSLARLVAHDASSTVNWLKEHGVRWRLQPERQAHTIDGRRRFWGNLPLAAIGGGSGLVDRQLAAALSMGVDVRCDSPVIDFETEDNAVTGVLVGGARPYRLAARATILCSGGFEANALLRARFLGSAWARARVRGTPHNTGELIMRAIELGAQPYGDWGGCHSIAWDTGTGLVGDRRVSNRPSRQGYPFGLVINSKGRRFLDEGADIRNYTYAKYGGLILKQPGSLAFQLFDQRTIGLVSKEDYGSPDATKILADSIDELCRQLSVPCDELKMTIERYNGAVQPGEFDPTRKDGKATAGLHPPKSNWALPFAHPPYVAFPVTCGITFTFGGLRVDTKGQVLRRDGSPLSGLLAAGETVGGLFYGNYAGGSGLAAGAVIGRAAGHVAAESSLAES